MKSQTLIKICGITDPLLAQETVAMGAHFVGLIMHQKSNRYVKPETAKIIAQEIKKAGGVPVAVFVDDDADAMKLICEYCEISIVQLHGSHARQTHSLLPENYQRIYVMPVNPNGNILSDHDGGLTYLNPIRDKLLFDNIEGGTGTSFNLTNFKYHGPFNYFIAGGLTPQNVNAVITQISPAGVDVSSGVESSSGKKDKNLINLFIRAVNQ
jgi:phosphoribosylanthranilate isomerase